MDEKFTPSALPVNIESAVLPPAHPPVQIGRIGVLLINLGTPEATDFFSMRRYLKQFLSDPRVVEINRVVWWFILNGIILNVRPQRSAKAYDKIWNRALNESPLKTITRAQSLGLQTYFKPMSEVVVDWGMRYGQPPVGERLQQLQQQGCDRILLFPLYPQYSASTTATAVDACMAALKTMRWQPALRIVPPYYAETAYIEALATSVEQHQAQLGWVPDVILASFHGLPKSYLISGDPYYCHCMKTTRLLRARLGLSEDKLRIVFQSRFGKTEWLQPYAQSIVEALPAQGVKNLLILTPGFAADCVETLEEVAIGLEESFLHQGGKEFSMVPCLNDSAPSLNMLAQIAQRELAGWC